MAKREYQTEVNQLLHLMIHSLYSNKEIFLRELISNASDAIDKLKYLTLTDEKLKSLPFNPRIDLKVDSEKKIIVVSDTGIGMDEEDLVENLGTIAKSGTKAFVEQLTGDAKKDSNLIGQFGVGFYSAFMVADKVEVLTKKAGTDKAFKWVSDVKDNGYEITESEKESYGTEITLYLRDDAEEFANEYRIEGIVKKYSNHVPYPIFMDKKEFSEDGKESEVKNVQLNAASALWTKNKKDLTDEDYISFYSTIAHSSEKPLKWIHTKAEGAIEYTTLFYIPEKAPLDLYRVDYQSGLKLYIKRVFISDDDKELLPTYLRFIRGIIDSEDLPLNVSREILQHNPILTKIQKASVKNIFKMISKLDDEKYKIFWNEFGKVLKEGIGDYENQEKILELCKFDTNKREFVSLDEIEKDDKTIYYLIGKDKEILKNSPLLENTDKEVILLSDEIDELVFPMVMKYKDFELKALDAGEVEDKSEEYKDLIEKVKATLGDLVKDVKVTNRLKETPAVIIYDEPHNPQMEMMMRQMGMEAPKPKPILELNPNSDIVKSLSENYDEDKAGLLFDEACISAGEEIKNVKAFTERLNRVLSK